ncbi:hypothetical protein BS47DRAFT_1389138 [Hydnum rufescens UP504]|uniref:Uncharacterized protein n=1 Tax=Hydnum rufescens UP504 TaxID=1448309 RepID=A0A9P6B5U5_9AGAM|nr:hypothetical protein BS47DRAFT_1389138 [Hydnum rufescens UP504]
MLAHPNANLVREAVAAVAVPPQQPHSPWSSASLNWIVGSRPCGVSGATAQQVAAPTRMTALEEERIERMKETPENVVTVGLWGRQVSAQPADDEGFVRRELNSGPLSGCLSRIVGYVESSDASCVSSFLMVVFQPGTFVGFFCLSFIVKTGADLRQEQMVVQLVQGKRTADVGSDSGFHLIVENSPATTLTRLYCLSLPNAHYGDQFWIGGDDQGHSIYPFNQKGKICLTSPRILNHGASLETYGDASSAKFARAQRYFIKSLTDDRLIHIDFGFLPGNSSGNMGLWEQAFKLVERFSVDSTEHLDILYRSIGSSKGTASRASIYTCMLPAWGP